MLLGPGIARAATRGAAVRAPASAGSDALATRAVGTLRGGGAVHELVLSVPACLAAVRWRTPVRARIELRAQRPDGEWGPWGSASCGGHEGDGVRSAQPFGEGIWIRRTRRLQLRSREAVHGVAVVLVAADAVRDPATDGLAADLSPSALPLVGPALPAGPGQPPIIARGAWAGSSHPPVAGPDYGTIEMGVVHHTENPNGYSPGEVPALLRAIYEFHVHGRGWFDIGYNFVIDSFGRIWEARQGGISLPVMGAQAGDWNQISFGVAMLGTYSDVLPSAAALDSLQRLLAWKLALSGVPATGEIAAVVTPDGVAWTQFHVGEHVRFPRIAGHRQVDATSCPGNDLYAHLPALRARVATLAGTSATLAVQAGLTSFVDGRTTLEITGRLAAPASTGVRDTPILIQEVVGTAGATRTLATARTDAGGRWSATLTPAAGMLLRALHAARPAVVSDLFSVDQAPAPGVNLLRAVRVSGRAVPGSERAVRVFGR